MEANDLSGDLEHILDETRLLWDAWRGKKLFITGGTGFFGTWILESFAFANERLGLGAEAVVLSRDPASFARKMPSLVKSSSIRFLTGDIATLGDPQESFDYCIHAATPADAKMIEETPLYMLDTIVSGTRRVLDFAVKANVKKFLLTSSGAVYGRQPVTLSHVDEEYLGAPELYNPKSSYGEGKRMAEHLTFLVARQTSMEAKVARCFAFIGIMRSETLFETDWRGAPSKWAETGPLCDLICMQPIWRCGCGHCLKRVFQAGPTMSDLKSVFPFAKSRNMSLQNLALKGLRLSWQNRQ